MSESLIDVCLLGCGGMMPLENRWLSSLLIRYNGKLLLIDCGECTQIPFKLTGWGFKTLEAIFITHYHADHISGLPGFLLTLGNNYKTTPLKIYGPPGLKRIVDGLTVICPDLPYKLELFELSTKNTTDLNLLCGLNVRSTGAEHTLPCLAYSVHLERKGVFNADAAKTLDIPVKFWSILQSGKTIEHNNKVFYPDMVMGRKRKGLKLSCCTDTRPTENLTSFIKDSDLLVCEANYDDISKLEKAKEKKHMLFFEAANLAQNAGVKKLILTHFSPSIDDPFKTLSDTRNIFSQTYIGTNLMKTTLKFNDT